MTSQVPAAIDLLVDLFTAALPEGVTVVDGLQTSFPSSEWAVVGGDGPVQQEEDAARADQEWRGIGGMIRDESINVTCAVGSSTGNAETSMRPRRQAAYALLTAVESALRADPGLGGFTTGGAAAITETFLRYFPSSQGLGAAVVFTINIPVRSGP